MDLFFASSLLLAMPPASRIKYILALHLSLRVCLGLNLEQIT